MEVHQQESDNKNYNGSKKYWNQTWITSIYLTVIMLPRLVCASQSKILFNFQQLDSRPLPAHYKPYHLLDKLTDLPAADLHTTVEPVPLNAVNVQKSHAISPHTSLASQWWWSWPCVPQQKVSCQTNSSRHICFYFWFLSWTYFRWWCL